MCGSLENRRCVRLNNDSMEWRDNISLRASILDSSLQAEMRKNPRKAFAVHAPNLEDFAHVQ